MRDARKDGAGIRDGTETGTRGGADDVTAEGAEVTDPPPPPPFFPFSTGVTLAVPFPPPPPPPPPPPDC